jgi:hypothetical protein
MGIRIDPCERPNSIVSFSICLAGLMNHHLCWFQRGRAMSVKGKRLADFPEILKQWHPTKNPPQTYYGKPIETEDILAGSGKKIWWKCPVADDHEWPTSVANRTFNGTGCPFCANQKVCSTNSLSAISPELARQWHPNLNGDLTPDDVLAYTGKRVWWICQEGTDHVWPQTPSVRLSMGTGCPFCQNLAVSVTNSLPSQFPEIASEWHPTKNGEKTPEDFVAYSGKKVWWKCPVADDHEWITAIEKRTREGQGCPCCAIPIRKVVPSNSLASTHPIIAEQWDMQKNKKAPTEVVAGSSTKAWWICEQGHSFPQMISNRTTHKQTCPYCAGQKVLPDGSNSLATAHPSLIEEWDSEQNHPITPWDIRPATHKKFHWKCRIEDCGHKWLAAASSRTHFATGCPSCAKYGIDRGAPTYLYAMRIEGPTGTWWWKGGVSVDPERRARQVERSIRNVGMDLDVILHEVIEIETGLLALDIEASMMGEEPIRETIVEQFDGSTELFNLNPLQWARDSGMFQRGAL